MLIGRKEWQVSTTGRFLLFLSPGTSAWLCTKWQFGLSLLMVFPQWQQQWNIIVSTAICTTPTQRWWFRYVMWVMPRCYFRTFPSFCSILLIPSFKPYWLPPLLLSYHYNWQFGMVNRWGKWRDMWSQGWVINSLVFPPLSVLWPQSLCHQMTHVIEWNKHLK